MTNEELAVRIQQGEQNLIPKLWHQVVKFISFMARQYLSQKKLRGAYCAAEEDDLVNQAYFGFLTAIKGFNPDKGKFLAYLDLAIRTSFLQATGRYSVPQQFDASHIAQSGDAPVGDSDDFCLFDTVADECADPDAQVVDALYLEQLHKALDNAMKQLPQRQEQILRSRYYKSQTHQKIAKELSCTASNVGSQEQAALDALYNARFFNGLNEYLEVNTNWHLHVGVTRFKSTRISSVEEIVLRREELVSRWMHQHYGRGSEENVPTNDEIRA